jgi:hypothetical protein
MIPLGARIPNIVKPPGPFIPHIIDTPSITYPTKKYMADEL